MKLKVNEHPAKVLLKIMFVTEVEIEEQRGLIVC